MKPRGISGRLLAILVLAEFACLTAAVGGLWLTRAVILDERKDRLRAVISASASMIDHFRLEAASGRLSESQARELALGAMRHMRYDGADYLIVFAADGARLVHGAHPEWEGLPGPLPAGSGFDFAKVLELAQSGGGFSRYEFPRPDGGKRVPKLAYAQSYLPWGWVLVTGLYLDDVDAAFLRQIAGFAALLLVVALALSFELTRLGRRILQPLTSLGAAMTERSADLSGRPRQPVPCDSDDELGAVVKAYNALLERQEEAERQLLAGKLQLEEQVRLRTGELDQARHQAEQANRVKADFLANISHEIRTPMNAVVGLTHLLIRTKLDEHQRDYLSKIAGSARALLRIIDDILDFSRIEAHHLTLEVVSFSLDDVLRTLADLIALPAGAKGLEVVFDLDPRIPTRMRGDPLRISQILSNLANNAVKFTERGSVTIACKLLRESENGLFLRCAVTDTGIGLTELQQNQLFAPFTQLDSGPSRRFGGTGLGLAISKQLVGLMAGEIGVESVPGRGSTFWFTLRLGRHADSAPAPEPSFPKIRVLVADDNLLVRHTIAAMLGGLGCRTTEVAGGQAALDAVSGSGEDPFDLLMIDWMMPDLDGIETVRRLHGLSLPCPPRIIMVSGYGQDELLPQILSLGLDGMLPKPINRGQLIEALQRCFGPPSPEASEGRPAFPQGTRVLVVEDNEINCMVANEVLAEAGIAVILAGNGREGVDAVLRESFDAVLMDIQMPVMDGYAATREIRRNGRFAGLPIIAVTANAGETDRRKALEAGMNDHIAKPFEPEILLRLLRRWIDKSRETPATSPLREG